jgi:hypothetical protein
MKKFTLLLCLTAIILAISNKTLKAQVIYTDVNPDTTIFIPTTLTSNFYNFDLDKNHTMDFIFLTEKWIADVGGHDFVGRGSGLLVISTSNKVAGGCWAYGNNLLYTGDTINNTLIWMDSRYLHYAQGLFPWSCWVEMNDTYFGLELVVDFNTYYGWVRCDATDSSVTIKDYAYNSIPNGYILAGLTIGGINDFNDFSTFYVSPNPFRHSTQITLPQTCHHIALEVYDIQGKLIEENHYSDCSQIQLNRNGLNDGMYFLKMTLDEKQVVTGKIVVGE